MQVQTKNDKNDKGRLFKSFLAMVKVYNLIPQTAIFLITLIPSSSLFQSLGSATSTERARLVILNIFHFK